VVTRLNGRFISKGVPVIMGEWASKNKNNLSDRVNHAQYYVSAFKKISVPVVWWDNNIFDTTAGDPMGLLDRNAMSWKFQDIVTAIMTGLN
jgi:endoglucanase